MKREHTFKLNNPYKPDEKITQEVVVSNKLQYDYSSSDWIAIDAEFLGLNLSRDALCTIQISSPDPEDELLQRVEIIYVYKQEIDQNLKELLTSDKLKIFHVYSSDIPMLNQYLDLEVTGPIFDTKVAAKIVWTNSQNTSKTSLIKNFGDPTYQKMEEGNSLWEMHPDKWPSKMIEYASLDVLYLNSIRQKLNQIAEMRGRRDLLDEAMSLLPKLGKLHQHGYDLSIYRFSD